MAKAKKAVSKEKTKKAGTAAETNIVRRVTAAKKNSQIGEFRSGDSVNVYVKVKEGEKERVQVYKGVVTKIQGSGSSRSFTVRKISAGVGVERTFPFASPSVDRVERLTIGQVRRSRLYYLRGLEGKAAKINSELARPMSKQAQAEEQAQAEKTEA
ncbi:MAG: 50S ribosomal protein L19 [Bdellovibrio sp. CG10_big_fil_rev_8_21_14_0_10_47_8]|nr:MAG: 50S ribosomal protein L19 [Bdellovibrio sp. CG10_big_fil_rev_8_21_14_0_10_47_8]